MRKLVAVSAITLTAVLTLPSLAWNQTSPSKAPDAVKDQKASAPAVPVPLDGWGKPAIAPPKTGTSAPRHDISGTWQPAVGPSDGIQALGAKAMPSDGKPEHELPYTPAGLEAFNRTKPGFGVRMSPPGEINDPVNYCDPQGIPREDLYEVRTTQILQTPISVVILYEYGKVWRVIWTDGRELPKDPESRWYGYSVGRWVDDNTLVAETIGTDERTWVDNAGRPHSGDLRIEERFHRVDHDALELTVTLDDPKFYTKPWVALDKFPMRLDRADFDVREMICSPSEFADYNKEIGNRAAPSPPPK
jgi:hypothetical protein